MSSNGAILSNVAALFSQPTRERERERERGGEGEVSDNSLLPWSPRTGWPFGLPHAFPAILPPLETGMLTGKIIIKRGLQTLKSNNHSLQYAGKP